MNEGYQNYITQLTAPMPQMRYEAVCWLARYRASDDWKTIYDAIWNCVENDPDRQVVSAAGIAASMISACNMPSGIFFGGPVPDFLGEWQDVQESPK